MGDTRTGLPKDPAAKIEPGSKSKCATGPTPRPKEPLSRLEKLSYGSMALGCACVVLFCVNSSSFWGVAGRLGTVTAIALGAAVCGAIVGFLFGIPRTLQQDR